MADDAPPAPPNAERHQAMAAAMRQARSQAEQIHLEARAQMLAALSPAHRQLFADVVGELAIAQSPDVEGAARKIDVALSAGERSQIASIHQTAMTQLNALHESMRAQMESMMPPDAQAKMAGHDRQMGAHQAPPTDAGHLLLGMSLAVLGGFHEGPPPGMAPPGMQH
jgi:hypothetical protein